MNVFTLRNVVAEFFSTAPSGGYFGAPGILLLDVHEGFLYHERVQCLARSGLRRISKYFTETQKLRGENHSISSDAVPFESSGMAAVSYSTDLGEDICGDIWRWMNRRMARTKKISESS